MESFVEAMMAAFMCLVVLAVIVVVFSILGPWALLGIPLILIFLLSN